ncbi:hypothetical protein K0M31_009544 [Melipona bicolor]|uniref:Uncharacterized protein n=1 Tax=Melipona bicolor TaxID=60889 RepID=A0AA40FNF1_9HYME|nr:hypothetical protein K0M31_009544 [Melipona bicolor]
MGQSHEAKSLPHQGPSLFPPRRGPRHEEGAKGGSETTQPTQRRITYARNYAAPPMSVKLRVPEQSVGWFTCWWNYTGTK